MERENGFHEADGADDHTMDGAILTLSDADIRHAAYLMDAVELLEGMGAPPESSDGRHHRPDDVPAFSEVLDLTQFDILEDGFRQLIYSLESELGAPSPVTGRRTVVNTMMTTTEPRTADDVEGE